MTGSSGTSMAKYEASRSRKNDFLVDTAGHCLQSCRWTRQCLRERVSKQRARENRSALGFQESRHFWEIPAGCGFLQVLERTLGITRQWCSKDCILYIYFRGRCVHGPVNAARLPPHFGAHLIQQIFQSGFGSDLLRPCISVVRSGKLLL